MEQVRKLKDQGRLALDCLIVADNVADRASEMPDFLEWAAALDAVIVPTECGLLVVRI